MKWFVIGYKQGNKRGLDSTNKIGARLEHVYSKEG